MLKIAGSLHTAGAQFRLCPSGNFSPFVTPLKVSPFVERLREDREVRMQDLNATSGKLSDEAQVVNTFPRMF